MIFIYLLLLINIYYVFSFNYLKFNNKFKPKKSILFLNKNNNIYLNKNNSRVLQTSTYLESLEKKKVFNNPKIIKNISFYNINKIIKNSNIYYINLYDYPAYIINSPFGFFTFEKK